MPTTASVGQSTSHSARHAGREAAGSALDGLRGEASFLLLFATTGYDQGELLAGVAERAGDTPLSGCSAEGVIAQQLSDEGAHAVVVMAVASSSAKFTPWLATGLAKAPRECGIEIAKRIRAESEANGLQARCLLLFPDGVSGNSSDLLSGLQEALPYPILIVGGRQRRTSRPSNRPTSTTRVAR